MLCFLVLLTICYFATPLPLWATPPSLYIHTISSFLTSCLISPLALCSPLHDIPFFCIFHMLGITLLLLLCTSLILVNVLPQVYLCHNAPLLSSLTLLPNSSSILAVLFVAWPRALPSLLPSSTFFLIPAIAVKGCKRELHTGTNKIMMCQLPIAY